MAIKFGTGQVGNPTPSGLNLWVRVFTVAAAIFIGWMGTNNLIGPHSKDIINGILGLLLLLANGLAPLFGIQLLPNQKVNADDVTAMEDKGKP